MDRRAPTPQFFFSRLLAAWAMAFSPALIWLPIQMVTSFLLCLLAATALVFLTARQMGPARQRDLLRLAISCACISMMAGLVLLLWPNQWTLPTIGETFIASKLGLDGESAHGAVMTVTFGELWISFAAGALLFRQLLRSRSSPPREQGSVDRPRPL